MTEQNIPANAEGTSKEIQTIRAFEALEADAYYMQVLADLAAEVFDNLQRDTDADKNGYIVYRLGKNQVKQLDFLLNEQVRRTNQLDQTIRAARKETLIVVKGSEA
ncbi:hypothetical protein [Ochrobactrum sp. AP1BH01-1]|jgi:hypothetical protein|uniref:hypothetical protein n=1 Tax=Ochrobactrum sp. AP1BH01-1 TaxID=2823874 RepID=UPI001B35C73A|nr:hypothetical protein [Ochrobactrum sp. AP1BH01-1]MBQ0707870.1 hypothetical protein [Ochrobactrum sp. AP1BH01-1]